MKIEVICLWNIIHTRKRTKRVIFSHYNTIFRYEWILSSFFWKLIVILCIQIYIFWFPKLWSKDPLYIKNIILYHNFRVFSRNTWSPLNQWSYHKHDLNATLHHDLRSEVVSVLVSIETATLDFYCPCSNPMDTTLFFLI